MSTPVAKPFRSDNVRLLVQKDVGCLEQREPGEREGADGPPTNFKIVEDDAAPGQAGNRENCPSPAQVAEGVPRDPDLEHGDNGRAKESADEKPDDGSLEAQDQSTDARRRHAQAAEIDKGYDEKLEVLAHNLQALRREAEPVDPEQSTPLLLDGMLLQRFMLSSDFDPPQRGTKLAAILPIGIACAVVAMIAYYFAVGNPFASGSNESWLRSELQHAMGLASVSEPASEVDQSGSATGKNPQSTPARAIAMSPSGMDSDEIQLLLKQGQEFVAVGDLATARVVLRRAAEAGAAAAAFALAQCYDPKVLTQMRARGVAPDTGEARRWYEIARQLGSAEAARHLEVLPPE